MKVDEIDVHDSELVATLREAGLPAEDLAAPVTDRDRRIFRFRAATGAPIGYIGWEATGQVALLRSLVVLPACRGQGWSRIMTDWALRALAARGMTQAYVLTTDSEPLARQLGFSRIERAQAPPEIRGSHQFASLCPVTAVLMQRHLT